MSVNPTVDAKADVAHAPARRAGFAALRQRFSQRAFVAYKYLYQLARWPAATQPKSVLFIVGCQRSGTTLMKRIFDRELQAVVYREFSRLSSGDRSDRIRLNPLPEVAEAIAHDHAPLVVIKPLVETQNLLRILHFFRGSKAVFMYRHYQDVAASDLKHFGPRNGINNLRPIVARDSTNWRSEEITGDVRQIVTDRFSEDMNPHDAAALFWYVRNRLFFDLGLEHIPAVLPLRYESLVREPAAMLTLVYDLMGLRGPVQDKVRDVHARSVNKGAGLNLSEDVQRLCTDLHARLESVFERRLARTAR